MRYLKGHADKGLFYTKDTQRNALDIQGFVDVDWAGPPSDRRSTSVYCIKVGGNLLVRKSQKHNVVAKSSAEAEYRAVAKAMAELVWMKQLLKDLGFTITMEMKLWGDNQAAIYIANNHVFYERTKYIEIDCHFVRDKVKERVISLEYIHSNIQLVDVMTKPCLQVDTRI